MNKKFLFLIILVIVIAFIGYQYWNNNQVKEISSSDSSLADIKARGKLVIASDIPYGVMEFFDESGKAVGVDIDIAKKIADSIGVSLEVKDHDFENIFLAMKNGEVDLVMSAVTITIERQKEMLFSIPYFNGGQSVVTKKDNNTINSVENIIGKKIGAQIETTGNDLAKEKTEGKFVFTFKDPAEMVDSLKAGKIDLFLVDYVAAIDLIKENPSFKIVGEPLTQEFYGVVTKLGNNSLMEKINSLLREMKRDGRLQQIEKKWLKLN